MVVQLQRSRMKEKAQRSKQLQSSMYLVNERSSKLFIVFKMMRIRMIKSIHKMMNKIRRDKISRNMRREAYIQITIKKMKVQQLIKMEQ
jgi:hypothetical protein